VDSDRGHAGVSSAEAVFSRPRQAPLPVITRLYAPNASARSMPHTLRAVDRDSEVLSALKVLSGFDADLTHECIRAINRLRSLLLQIFPALERVFPKDVLTRALVLDMLIKYAGPTGLRAAGRATSCAGPVTIAARTLQSSSKQSSRH
jgi:hypothetical protein